MSHVKEVGLVTPKMTPIQERAARGEYDLIEPLDWFILEKLPEEGTLFAGMYPLGETVANIAIKLPKVDGKPLDTKIVAARVRSLQLQGLTNPTKGGTHKRVWQRTKKASEMFNKWKESRGGSNSK